MLPPWVKERFLLCSSKGKTPAGQCRTPESKQQLHYPRINRESKSRKAPQVYSRGGTQSKLPDSCPALVLGFAFPPSVPLLILKAPAERGEELRGGAGCQAEAARSGPAPRMETAPRAEKEPAAPCCQHPAPVQSP